MASVTLRHAAGLAMFVLCVAFGYGAHWLQSTQPLLAQKRIQARLAVTGRALRASASLRGLPKCGLVSAAC